MVWVVNHFHSEPVFNNPIELLSTFGSVAAAVAAWIALRQSNKKLEIEQTPYVVLDHIRFIDSTKFGFSIKNVGGPALRVTFSEKGNIDNRNDAFFSDDQPHSANLRTAEESHYWKVDSVVLEELSFESGYAYLYCFFEDQAGSLFRTKVKIKKISKDDGSIRYIVMENEVNKLKGTQI